MYNKATQKPQRSTFREKAKLFRTKLSFQEHPVLVACGNFPGNFACNFLESLPRTKLAFPTPQRHVDGGKLFHLRAGHLFPRALWRKVDCACNWRGWLCFCRKLACNKHLPPHEGWRARLFATKTCIFRVPHDACVLLGVLHFVGTLWTCHNGHQLLFEEFCKPWRCSWRHNCHLRFVGIALLATVWLGNAVFPHHVLRKLQPYIGA